MVKFLLTFIRHGESTLNNLKVVQGQMDPPLSPDGVLQVESLSERMKTEQIDIVYTSDLVRARKTADMVIEKMTTPPRVVVEEVGLRERSFGVMEGIPISEYRAWLAANGTTFRTHKPDKGESFGEAGQRIIKVFNKICEDQLGREDAANGGRLPHVMVAGHGLIFKELFAYFINELNTTDIPGGEERVRKDSANTNVSRFEVEFTQGAPPKLSCQLLYDFSHLPQAMQDAIPSKAY